MISALLCSIRGLTAYLPLSGVQVAVLAMQVEVVQMRQVAAHLHTCTIARGGEPALSIYCK